jgi:hypothetical protein
MTELRNLLILILQRNSQWPRWGLSGSVQYTVVLYTSILAPIFSPTRCESVQFLCQTSRICIRTAWIRFYLSSASLSEIKGAKLASKLGRKQIINVELDSLSGAEGFSWSLEGSSDAFHLHILLIFFILEVL